MKHHFINYFTTWWHSVVTLLVFFLLFILGITVVKNDLHVAITLLFIVISALLTIASAIVQFIKLKWIKGLGQLALVVVLFQVVGFILVFYPVDFYANGLELPKDVKLELPIDLQDDADGAIALQNSEPYNLKFELAYSSSQPGIYTYYLWLKPKERGTIYLKAFEITENDQLSAESLKLRSSAEINSDNINLYSRRFTIYEGDWDQPYGARIEVWLKPDNGGKDYKLLQKNYKIEGWMR
ncbi:hypothetical protein [Flavobacterium subsaxonicum]|uniref:Uncharacterized protein n=1 Tax=Flavobacterium subsaxonicum WB 4.1-42 = DSM 21790 TaxID=1121898 RepID=A0A0A2MJQ3_9FLAO|nr:hypothetical protein [Flavobacterium subsaxonicum]KGO91816.1 hypothetical protein Q766_16410 [Flavobacterium subsaxonicum WB 4.1-42 = DSM 21790]